MGVDYLQSLDEDLKGTVPAAKQRLIHLLKNEIAQALAHFRGCALPGAWPACMGGGAETYAVASRWADHLSQIASQMRPRSPSSRTHRLLERSCMLVGCAPATLFPASVYRYTSPQMQSILDKCRRIRHLIFTLGFFLLYLK